VARHLNDETAEFKMPRPGKHSAEDDEHAPEAEASEQPEPTQRFDPGFRDRPRPAPPAPESR
jgi:hypothetical protein